MVRVPTLAQNRRLVQALVDAGAIGHAGLMLCATEIDRTQARMFLTQPRGDWARSRELWAEAAGIDPDILRKRAVALLAAPPKPVPRRRSGGPQPGSNIARMIDAIRRGATLTELKQIAGHDNVPWQNIALHVDFRQEVVDGVTMFYLTEDENEWAA